MGGLAIVPGSNRAGVARNRWFEEDFAGRDHWARADYRYGDVLMFPGSTLHSGMRNLSPDRFRMSLDIRMYLNGSPRPVVGPVASISADEVVIEGKDGGKVALGLADDTMILVMVGNNEIPTAFHRSEVASVLHPGREVMAVGRDNVALILRPANSGGY